MADTAEFFTQWLPEKISKDPGLAESINASFQFDIEGAGTWTLDMTDGKSEVKEGAVDDPGCVFETDKDTWEKILDNPKLAIQMVMLRKLKVSNISLGTQLQKILA